MTEMRISERIRLTYALVKSATMFLFHTVVEFTFFSFLSAFLQKNKSYKIGLVVCVYACVRARARVCVFVCVCAREKILKVIYSPFN